MGCGHLYAKYYNYYYYVYFLPSLILFLLPLILLITPFSFIISSWFDITDTVLAWFQSYLSSCSVCILASGSISYPFHLRVVYLKDPFSDQFFSTCNDTPLSSLISSQYLNHHLSADDSQLFISFTTKSFLTAVNQLQDTISDISSWMTSNILSKPF